MNGPLNLGPAPFLSKIITDRRASFCIFSLDSQYILVNGVVKNEIFLEKFSGGGK